MKCTCGFSGIQGRQHAEGCPAKIKQPGNKSASVVGSGVKLSPSFYKAYGSRIFLYIAGRDEFGEPMGTEHSISHNEATRLLAELRKVLP